MHAASSLILRFAQTVQSPGSRGGTSRPQGVDCKVAKRERSEAHKPEAQAKDREPVPFGCAPGLYGNLTINGADLFLRILQAAQIY